MDLYTKLSLTSTGTPQILINEAIHLIQIGAQVYDDKEKKKELKYGSLYATSHRVLWIDADRKHPLQLHLKNIERIEHEKTYFGASKIVFHYSSQVRSTQKYSKIKFHEKGSSKTLSCLRESLSKRLWEKEITTTTTTTTTNTNTNTTTTTETTATEADNDELLSSTTRKRSFSARKAGISGLMLKQKEKHNADKVLATEAFGDLQSLMNKAEEIVILAQRYSDDTREESSSDQDQFKSLVMNIGIANPITRKGAGHLYHSELARELTNFILPNLETAGGMMTLTDIYCMYNRARGVDMVSPDDILAAVRSATEMELPVTLKTLNSGVLVVQSSRLNDDNIADQLYSLAKLHTSLTAFDLAKLWTLPVPIASSLLLMSEQKLKLCRDDNLNGIRFYPNYFIIDPAATTTVLK